MAIYFYKVTDKYGCFSNFSPHTFNLDGKVWITSEHYFQSQKFCGTEYEEKIRLLRTPLEAAEMGRSRKLPLRKDWEQVKDDIMRKAVLAKFTQNEKIANILISTKNEKIVEKTDNDYYWGCGKYGFVKNMLGKILMEVRVKLLCNTNQNYF